MSDRIEAVKCARNHGIDALRVLSMLMVVMLHVLGHGGILDSAQKTNYWIAWYLEIAAYCAVNCYALISGYVGVYSKYKISNLVILWCRVAFYSISLTVAFKLLFLTNIRKVDFLSAFFPVFSKRYWYFSAYAFMFLFIPILNEGLNRLSKKKMGIILITVVVLTTVIRPFFIHFWDDVLSLQNGYSALWLTILYLIGGYIRKYGLFQKINTNRSAVFFFLYLVVVSATLFSKYAIQLLSKKIGLEIKVNVILISYPTITILAAAVFLILAFEHIKFPKYLLKLISFLSPLAFSVYLIHEQTQIKLNFINNRFKWVAQLPSYQMIFIIVGIVVGIFVACSLLDLFRHYLFKALKLKERLELLEIKVKKKIADKGI